MVRLYKVFFVCFRFVQCELCEEGGVLYEVGDWLMKLI